MGQIKPEIETFAKIKVVGVGGGGGSAVNRMIKAGIQGVDFIALNTDVQALYHNLASTKLHIGKNITRGLGAGMDPEIGKRAAEESHNEIKELLAGSDMVFVTAGMGGGTGTGASHIVANIAKELGALVVAVVTKPFAFEGQQRMILADAGMKDLEANVDTLITIPNEKLFQITDGKISLQEAFGLADDILRQGIQGISELISLHGYVNVDFADVRSIMENAGSALMGVGQASGESRATEAAKMAINSPLLEMSIDGARGILFTITGGADLGVHEFDEAAKVITASADPDARIIFGTIVDETMSDEIRVTVIATGFDTDRHSSRGGIISRESSNLRKTSEVENRYIPTTAISDTNSLFKQTVGGRAVSNESVDERDIMEEEILDNETDFEDIQVKKVNLNDFAEELPVPKADKIEKDDDDDDDDDDIPAIIRNKMLNF